MLDVRHMPLLRPLCAELPLSLHLCAIGHLPRSQCMVGWCAHVGSAGRHVPAMHWDRSKWSDTYSRERGKSAVFAILFAWRLDLLFRLKKTK